MDYEKKYKEALKRAREWYNKTEPDSYTCIVESIFPELKESEDEKIRKELITHCRNTRCVTEEGAERIAKGIAWLEKQESLTIDEEKQGKEDVLWCIKQAKKYAKDENEMGTCWFAEQWLEKQGNKPQGKSTFATIKEEKVDNANKVEHKFDVGTWLAANDEENLYSQVMQITEIRGDRYGVMREWGHDSPTFEFVEEAYHDWTIADAKCGDILIDEGIDVIGIFEGTEGMRWHSKLFYSFSTKEFYGIECGGLHLNEFAKPATKEQRDTLMRAIAEAGYEKFDTEKRKKKK